MEEKVTTEKPKNPGRVEQGRKLGKLSKQKKLEAEKPEQIVKNYNYSELCSGKPMVYYYAYGVVIVGAMIGLCLYNCKAKSSQKVKEERNFSKF